MQLAEYQIKFRVITGNFLPPYHVDGLEIYKAKSAQEAVEQAKAEYAKTAGNNGFDVDEYPLNVIEVTKL